MAESIKFCYICSAAKVGEIMVTKPIDSSQCPNGHDFTGNFQCENAFYIPTSK